jgi:2'-hydroxyisoflavone reductase
MNSNRRNFLRSAAAAGLSLGMVKSLEANSPLPRQQSTGEAPKSLKLLVLGGTRFLGPAIVEAAKARGHEVTLFHRGRSNPDIFPELEHIIGNRDPKIEPGLVGLKGRKWDAVLDTSSYFPRITKAAVDLLADSVEQYLLVSSISVYPSLEMKGLTEEDEVGTIEDTTFEKITTESYGPLKALCEQTAEAAMPSRVTNVRPGLIVGPRDPSDRFSYWPLRVRAGGEVLAPGNPTDPIQWVDARDLGIFCISCVENKTMGVFNMAGPHHPADMAELVYGCKAVTGGDARFTWVDAEFLEAEGLQPWAHLPVWAPGKGEVSGINTVNCDRAIAAGFRTRPLAETVRDLLEWRDGWKRGGKNPSRAGMSLDNEKAALAKWHKRN